MKIFIKKNLFFFSFLFINKTQGADLQDLLFFLEREQREREGINQSSLIESIALEEVFQENSYLQEINFIKNHQHKNYQAFSFTLLVFGAFYFISSLMTFLDSMDKFIYFPSEDKTEKIYENSRSLLGLFLSFLYYILFPFFNIFSSFKKTNLRKIRKMPKNFSLFIFFLISLLFTGGIFYCASQNSYAQQNNCLLPYNQSERCDFCILTGSESTPDDQFHLTCLIEKCISLGRETCIFLQETTYNYSLYSFITSFQNFLSLLILGSFTIFYIFVLVSNNKIKKLQKKIKDLHLIL